MMVITHNRDILVKVLQTAKHQVITYTIPIYHDRPNCVPTIQITDNDLILTFNQEQQQNRTALKVSSILFDKPCTSISSPSAPPSVSKTEKTLALS
jgi:hypothetical protein